MTEVINKHFPGISEEKLRVVLRVAELQGANQEGIGNQYDWMRLLDVYRNRHAGP